MEICGSDFSPWSILWYNLVMRDRVLLRLYRLFFQQKKIAAVLLTAGLGIFVFLLPVQAAFADTIANLVGSLLANIAQIMVELVGKLFLVLIQILLAVTQYNDFINAPAVTKAWVLIRDFANMAFLVIFIAIAFATILGIEKYEYKQLLPKLLFMAVLINFSRTICGLVLDAAQVVMMTFVNGFKDVAAGNLIRSFGLTDLLTLNAGSSITEPRPVDNTSLAIASILALVILVISALVVGVIVAIFLIRIIYLWILVILSPLAFLMAATPGMSGKFSEWWGQFIKYAMTGPILAFFLWLSFSIMASVSPTENLAQSSGFGNLDPENNISVAITTISSSGNLLSFFIAIALLIMSLSVAQSLGVKGGQLAGSALSKIQSGGVKLAKIGALGVASGGLLAGGAMALGLGTKFGRRKLDDWVTPSLTKYPAKALSRAAKAVGLGDTRFGKGVGALAETGTKFRVISAGWKARKEKREKERTVTEAGAAQDLFNGVIDGKKTKYASRNQAALIHSEEKDQHENTSGTTEEYLEILKNGTEIEQKAALLNLAKQNDWNSANLDPEIGEKVQSRLIADLRKGIGESADKEISAILALSKSISEREQPVAEKGEAAVQAEIDVKAAEDELAIVRQGGDAAAVANQEQVVVLARTKANDAQQDFATSQQALETPEFKKDKEDASNRLSKLNRNERALYKYQRYKFVDSDRHKEALVKTMFGENPLTADYMAELGQIGLKSGAMGAFGLSRFNSESGEVEFTQTQTDEGMTKHLDALMSKFRNMKSGELLNIHPTVFRDEIIDENGTHRYDEEITEAGKQWISQAQQYFTERNIGNIRQDTVAALTGVHINKYQTGLRSLDPKKQIEAQRGFYAAMLAGFEKDLLPMLSVDAAKNFKAALDRYNPDKPPAKEEPKKEEPYDPGEAAD